MEDIGSKIYNLAVELFPIYRSITGDGARETLRIIKRHLPLLKIFKVPSGTRCFDWIVPPEWNIKDAYILDPKGKKIADFKKNFLHILAYSVPIHKKVSLKELNKHLYSLPKQSNAVPYASSFYEKRWGFCIAHNQKEKLKQGFYSVHIDTTLAPGYLNYGELLIPGKSRKEVTLSTPLCHPYCANNGLSGLAVTTYLAKWIMSIRHRYYTYRIVLVPQTIGSIYYVSQHLKYLKRHVKMGFNVTCVGDDKTYSYMPSRSGNTLADRIARHVLKHIYPEFIAYSFLERGGDERQYCSPGVDLPIVSVMRSKYGTYPQYRTSKDNLSFISPRGLYGGYSAIKYCILCAEKNEILKSTVLCEPHLGKKGLYPTLSIKEKKQKINTIKDVIAYSDGTRDLLDIADILEVKMWDLLEIVEELKRTHIVSSHR